MDKTHISNDTFATIVTFCVVFIALLIVFKVGTSALSKSIKGSPLGSLDRGLGVIFGLLTGFVVLSSLYLLDINQLGFFIKRVFP
ncbi:MAG: CvpA family protein [Holosporaceae bacterium]|nr:MAG: CvpA family protein [Holosporaceae bacterium]